MKYLLSPVLVAVLVLVAGCDGSSSGSSAPPAGTPAPTLANFELTITNLTNAQPLSPIAVIVHNAGYKTFRVGEAASVPLETLAEAGNNNPLVSDAAGDSNVMLATTGTGPIPPGSAQAIRFSMNISDFGSSQLSVLSMLVNTNDAFTGLNGMTIPDMAIGESITRRTVAYDAGTEADDELLANIPGPAAGGEGFNTVRGDRVNAVSMHNGVISQDDGFVTSELTEAHRFDNPVMAVKLTRIALP